MKEKPAVTLDRLLSRYGVASRRAAREAITGGRVTVNGRVVRDPEYWLTPGKDQVRLDGQRLRPERKLYLLFYKPKGVIVSHGDPSGRQTVYDCLRDQPPEGGRAPGGGSPPGNSWLAPAGRLDKDTSGLLILTNDTLFAHFLTDPGSGVRKTYRVKLSGLLNDETIAQLASGVVMKRGDQAHPVCVRRLEDRGKYTWIEVILTEGKNREVRRMVEAVGFKVLKLVRTAIGPLTLEGLEVGRWRALTPQDLNALRESTRLLKPRPGTLHPSGCSGSV
jgi:23S rRNA pseudouridine2605 synthase